MIPVQEAQQMISQNLLDWGKETIHSVRSLGRVLKEEVIADRDLPPFDRVTMDGIAICFADFVKGIRKFRIVHSQYAGMEVYTLREAGCAVEIMTGAICPKGCDTIIKKEDLEWEENEEGNFALVILENIKIGQNIHFQGSDCRKGDLLIAPGVFLNQAEVAVLTGVGKKFVQVSKLPKIAIISTGDELVDTEVIPKPQQIRRSNVYAMQAVLFASKMKSLLFHFPDDKAYISQHLKNILKEFDILLLSGGVSEGKADYIPQTLSELGVEKLFHKVKQRPGKPFWFGRKENKVVFALPGNPVSTVLCFYRYVLPYIYQSAGFAPTERWMVPLQADFHFAPELTYFLPVKLHMHHGKWEAEPFPGAGSGDYVNLLHCDGFLELPEGRTHFYQGEVFPFLPCKNLNYL